MWRLLEMRLRSQWPALLILPLGAAAAVGSLIATSPAWRQTPQRLATWVACLVLLGLWLYRRLIVFNDRQEMRQALLTTLPVSLSRLAWFRVLEPCLTVTLVATLVWGLGFIAGQMSGMPLDIPGQWLFACLASLVMLSEQTQLLVHELYLRWPGVLFSGTFWGLLNIAVIALGLGFWMTGHRLTTGLDAWPPFFSSGRGVLTCLVATVVLMISSQRLYLGRQDFTL